MCERPWSGSPNQDWWWWPFRGLLRVDAPDRADLQPNTSYRARLAGEESKAESTTQPITLLDGSALSWSSRAHSAQTPEQPTHAGIQAPELVCGRRAEGAKEAATIRIASGEARSGEGADDGESCEVSGLRRGDPGFELSVLWRRTAYRCGWSDRRSARDPSRPDGE